MSEESIVDREIKKIDAWLKKADIPESRLGMLACANQRAIERIREKKASIQTFQAVLEYIKRHPN